MSQIKSLILKAFLLIAFFSIAIAESDNSTVPGPSHDRVIVCVYLNWTPYRPEKGSFKVEDLDASLCTHLIYAFGKINESRIESSDPNQDLEDVGFGRYKKATELKIKYPHLKVLLALGGYLQNSIIFSKLAKNEGTRRSFVNNTVEYLTNYNFDGLSIAWNHPTARDRQNLNLLVKEMKTAFQEKNLTLTASIPVNPNNLNKGYDIPELSKYLDLLLITSYDYHGSWNGFFDHNSPLYGYNSSEFYVNYTIGFIKGLGAPPEKLVMGVPFNGRTFIKDPSQNQISQAPEIGATKVLSEGFSGPYSDENGFISYNEFCIELANSSNWTQLWDEHALVPYAFNEDKYVSFDNQRSIAEKVRYMLDNNLRGIMTWSVDGDDFRGDCPMESDTFWSFRRDLEVLNDANKDIIKDLDENEINGIFTIQDDNISIDISQYENTTFPLLRTIEQTIIIYEGIAKLKEIIKEKRCWKLIDTNLTYIIVLGVSAIVVFIIIAWVSLVVFIQSKSKRFESTVL